jgi:hypothetical protein
MLDEEGVSEATDGAYDAEDEGVEAPTISSRSNSRDLEANFRIC